VTVTATATATATVTATVTATATATGTATATVTATATATATVTATATATATVILCAVALDLCLDVGDPRELVPEVAVPDELLRPSVLAALGVPAPTWMRLVDGEYDDPRLTPEQAVTLASEVRLLRNAWVRRRREELATERKVTARDPALRDQILDGMLAALADPVGDALDAVIRLCDQATIRGLGLAAVSD
jgi:hypothetical protein